MKKYSNNDIRKLNKASRSSYSLIIPIRMVKKLGWRERQKLQVTLKGKRITIEDAK